jgi:hypothetical protein
MCVARDLLRLVVMERWPTRSLRGVVGVLVAIACGGNSTSDGEGTGDGGGTSGSGGSSSGRGGTGGTSTGGTPTGGSAGIPPSGGDAGSAPTGGDAGLGPTGGSAGVGAMGGSGGSGGSAGDGQECETADDCVMASDCCNCMAVPVGTSIQVCDRVCITDQCTAQQIGSGEVTCAFGRCVIDRSCNHARATCNSMPEPCPSGQARSVTENGCWGPCLAATECRDVTNCASCGDAVCAIFEGLGATYGCVAPDASCTKGNYCECLDACPQSAAYECVEVDETVRCICSVC